MMAIVVNLRLLLEENLGIYEGKPTPTPPLSIARGVVAYVKRIDVSVKCRHPIAYQQEEWIEYGRD